MIRQTFGEENMSRTRKVQTHRDRKKTSQVKSKVKSMLIIFFYISGIVHKEFRPGRPSSLFCILGYCDVLRRLRENMRKFRLELWQQKNWPLHHDNASSRTYFFTREFLTKNSMTVVSHPPYFSLFPRRKIKLKSRHFVTIEVIEAESQAGDYFEGDGGQ
jgi:hypothetical protein